VGRAFEFQVLNAFHFAVFGPLGTVAVAAAGAFGTTPAVAHAQEPLSPELLAQVRDLQDGPRNRALSMKILTSLTTEVGPRLAGTEAEARARAWALRTMKELGLENVRVETTPIDVWVRGEESARVVAPFPQPLVVSGLGGTVATPKDGIEAEVVRFETLAALERAEPQTVKGKIVFIDRPMPKTQDGSGYGTVVGIRARGAVKAARLGARAVLIRSVGTDSHRLPHTGMMRYAEGVERIPAAALSAPDADQLTRILERSDAPVQVALLLRSRFPGPATTGNVIGEIPGRTRPEEVVLIGAHLDSWDLGTGAVDDGSGVAIVLATAKRILEEKLAPARTVRVVLFGGEEVGLVGAKAYAKAHQDELERHVVAMESDFGAGPVYRLSARVGQFEAVRQLAEPLARLKVVLGDNEGHGGPDLVPMRDFAVPMLHLEQDGRDYFDVHHTADDTLDKVDPDGLAQNVSVWATVVWAVASTPVDFRSRAGRGGEADVSP
jgi:Zn-dependent M28 family amino/carboxypeptidase